LNVNLHAIDAANNLIVSEKEKLVVIKGLDGYFIVDTKDALLICKKDQEQEVKKLVGDIRKRYNGKYN
jgi:mannose-1-phosphate guanylyltransferase